MRDCSPCTSGVPAWDQGTAMALLRRIITAMDSREREAAGDS